MSYKPPTGPRGHTSYGDERRGAYDNERRAERPRDPAPGMYLRRPQETVERGGDTPANVDDMYSRRPEVSRARPEANAPRTHRSDELSHRDAPVRDTRGPKREDGGENRSSRPSEPRGVARFDNRGTRVEGGAPPGDRSHGRFEREDRSQGRFERQDRSQGRFEREDRSQGRFERGQSHQGERGAGLSYQGERGAGLSYQGERGSGLSYQGGRGAGLSYQGERGAPRFERRDRPTDQSVPFTQGDYRNPGSYRGPNRGTESRAPDRVRRSRPVFTKEELASVIPINKYDRTGSKWDIRPVGFETVSADRAKVSGLFALPGRKADAAEIKPVESTETGLHLEPIDSRSARTVVFPGDFINQPQFVKSLEAFVLSVAIKETENPKTVIAESRVGIDSLYVCFTHSTFATLVISLAGFVVPGTDVVLNAVRPGEYVVPRVVDNHGQPITVSLSDVVLPVVADSLQKMTLAKLATDTNVDHLKEYLTSFGPLRAFQPLFTRSKSFLGTVFYEFADPKANHDAVAVFTGDESGAEKSKEGAESAYILAVAFASCQGAKQEIEITYETLIAAARGSGIGLSKPSVVIAFYNLLTPRELSNEALHSEVVKEVEAECARFGTVVLVKSPRANKSVEPGLLMGKGVGAVFVKFDKLAGAQKALHGMLGRTFDFKTVVGSYYAEVDFNNGLF